MKFTVLSYGHPVVQEVTVILIFLFHYKNLSLNMVLLHKGKLAFTFFFFVSGD